MQTTTFGQGATRERIRVTARHGGRRLASAVLWLCMLVCGVVQALSQSLPANLNLQNITVGSGTAVYEAGSTINASRFVVGSASTHASAYLQAGSNVSLYPGFHVFPGSAFYAYITPGQTTVTSNPALTWSGSIGSPQSLALTLADPESPTAIAGGSISFLMIDSSGNIISQCPIVFTVSGAVVSLADARIQRSAGARGVFACAKSSPELLAPAPFLAHAQDFRATVSGPVTGQFEGRRYD